jgi:hypothetical protein
MLKYQQPEEQAAQTRVTPEELAAALASLESRATRREFDQAGTISLGDALREFSVEATPEELLAELDQVREQEAAREMTERRRRRRRLALRAEIVAAALCLTAFIVFQRTLLNPDWQQARQAADFQQHLRLATGPNPKYQVFVVPLSSRSGDGPRSTATTFGDWAQRPAYPVYSLPDGVDIHNFDGLDDDGRDIAFGGLPWLGKATAFVEFREPSPPFFRDNVSVFYNGLQYRRGFIRRGDLPRLLGGHSFTYYPALVAFAPYKIADIVPLTLSMKDIQEAHGQYGQAYPQCYNLVNFTEGNRVHLDEHAWENYPLPAWK